MSTLYPLQFEPLVRRYLWGGRRLETLGKPIGEGSDYAESWEIVDRYDAQSIVANGPLTGQTLHALVEQYPQALLGRHAGVERFPLLFKFLDANDRLSLQVHPDEARAALLTPPDFGKSEAWYIMDAEPHSYLYAGLRNSIDRDTLTRELARRTAELCCHRVEPRAGECYFLPAGVVHALGPGLLVAEIQRSSDTTYRLFDYDRLGPDGQPRKLHLDEAMEVINFDYGPVKAARPKQLRSGVEQLVACEYFVLDQWKISGVHQAAGDQRCHILAVLSGSIELTGKAAGGPWQKGTVVLLPAELGTVNVRAADDTVVLDAYLP